MSSYSLEMIGIKVKIETLKFESSKEYYSKKKNTTLMFNGQKCVDGYAILWNFLYCQKL